MSEGFRLFRTTPQILPQWAGLPARPLVMGIVNATPDSFSDGGLADPAGRGRAMIDAGADLLDIGGESTRPGAMPVSAAAEIARVVPVIAALAGHGVPLSIDTRNAATMAAALAAGATIVNDVSGLTYDPEAAPLVASRGCAVVLMHMRGTPATMASLGRYVDVAAEVRDELAGRLRAALAAGIAARNIAMDPGFGFAKPDVVDNVALLQALPTLTALGHRVVVGVSRKGMIGRLGGGDPGERDAGSLAAGLFALGQGASVLRVHDVAGTARAVRVWRALCG